VNEASREEHALRRIESLRSHRVRPERGRDLSGDFAQTARSLQRSFRKLGGVGKAWSDCCPASLLRRTAVVSLHRGVLTIRASDAPTRYELDRWLRQAGQDQVIQSCPTTVRRVRVVVGHA